jgi:uncharacterized repeat protein (TIGR03837 family)
MRSMRKHWDIFCRVIDNFGDIGVCWRLARQLTLEHGMSVRLWVDDLASLTRLVPETALACPTQRLEGVTICQWPEVPGEIEPGDVVIEAFACELPTGLVAAMARRRSPPCWINLEYLSAEAWVEGCHTLASTHPEFGLKKHFFFPGFTTRTGGLLRESGLLEARKAFQSRLERRLGIEVSLFCYEQAAVADLFDAMASGDEPVLCHVPEGKPLQLAKAFFGAAETWQHDNLLVRPMPFLAQRDYDALLWRCDINLVRGEDSFIRAQWAGRPFVWQVYPQRQDAHLDKLHAFLSRYTATLPEALAETVRAMFLAWNTGKNVGEAWACFAAERQAITDHAAHWSDDLAQQSDLATNLVKFCAGKV